MAVKYFKSKGWEKTRMEIVWNRCRNFNQKAERFYAGKEMEKAETETWGKCATDCIRHLEVLVKQNCNK